MVVVGLIENDGSAKVGCLIRLIFAMIPRSDSMFEEMMESVCGVYVAWHFHCTSSVESSSARNRRYDSVDVSFCDAHCPASAISRCCDTWNIGCV